MKSLKVCLLAVVLLGCVNTAMAGRPVARWDVVEYQLIDSSFKVGVAAFHIDGCEVEFSVDSTVVATAEDPTYNDRTGVWEYFFTLDPSSYSDGPLTIDATVSPLNATDSDYTMPSITLYANSGGTLGSSVVKYADSVNGLDTNDGSVSSPYATLAKAVSETPAGGTVYLKAGTYVPTSLGGGTRNYWTTITAAPGVDREDVLITKGRPSTQRLKFQNVKIISTSTSGSYDVILTGNGTTTVHYIWLDDVELCNVNGRYAASTNVFNNGYVGFITGGYFHNICNGPGSRLIRDMEMETITSDAWSGGGKLVVNSNVTDIDPGSTGAHPDFHQSYTTAPNYVENVILYNVKGIDVECQGLFGSRLKNSAFVNVLIDRVSGVYYRSQYSGPMENVLYAHVTLFQQSWMWRGSDTNALAAIDLNVVNNLFVSMSFYEDAQEQPGLIQNYNNFAGGTAFGTNYTTGDPEFIDAANKDFHLEDTSPAYCNGLYLQCVPADINGDEYNSSGRNRGCCASGTTSSNVAPTADAGSDQSVTDTDNSGAETVTLNGTASSDSDGSIVSYIWTENSTQIATGSQPSVSLAVGTHTITLTVTDDDSATDTDTVVITVEAPSGYASYEITGDPDDQVRRSDGSAKWVGQADMRVGGGVAGADCAAILVFELPTLAAGENIDTAALDVYYLSLSNNPGGHVDVYGLGYRASSTVLASDFYQGSYDGDTSDAWALEDDFATTSSTVGWLSLSSGGEANLADYIQAQYDAGAQGGDFVFIRLNPDVADVTNYYYWVFASADYTGYKPVLTIETAIGNAHPTADAGSDQNVTDTDGDGSASVSLDGTGSSDSDGTISSYVWSENAVQIATGSQPSVNLPIGQHQLQLTVTDDDSDTGTDLVDIDVYGRTLTGEYTWPVNVLPTLTGSFTVEFDLTANLSNVDAVTGLASGEPDWWSDLACIVRLNSGGYLDVRDGSGYAYDATVNYVANDSFHVEMLIDVSTAIYSVYVTPDGGSRTLLAEDYAFRTEQSSITNIDHWTLNDTNDENAHTVSNLIITN